MRRIVKFETKYGTINLTELSSDKILNGYKIYLPISYRTVYCNGNPSVLGTDSFDFTEDKYFHELGIINRVFIVNLNAQRTSLTSIYLLNRNDDIDKFRFMISICHMAEILFDENGNFVNIAYRVFGTHERIPETIYLFDDDYPFENYLLEENNLNET